MTAAMNSRQMTQWVWIAICSLSVRSVLWVFGILWDIIREIVNGLFRVVIGVIVAILSVILFFGIILWLLTL